MAFFSPIISEVSIILSHLSEITGLTPLVLIISFALLVLLSIGGLFIFIEFKRIRKMLMNVNRSLIVLGQKSEQQQPESKLAKISCQKEIFDPTQDIFFDSNKQYNDTQEVRTTSPIQDESQRNGVEGFGDKLLDKKMGNTTNINIDKSPEPLNSDPELKSAILKLIKKSDVPLTLEHIAENASENYFDGNYHLILNELEQLEKEGHIKGASMKGKVYYKKK